MLSGQACDSLLELEPGDEIIAEEAINTPQDLQELLNATYDVLRGSGGDFMGGRTQAIAEVMGDNIDGKSGSLDNADFLAYYNKSTSIFTGYTQAYFTEPHFLIYRANVLLQNLELEGLSSDDKNRIEGEAKFLRALCYFDLVRLFAQPYGYTADNSHLGVVLRTTPESVAKNRNTVAEVYALITSDLTDAAAKLPTENGVYANQWAAKALLSKVYFHMHDYQNTYDLANDVIENGPNKFNSNASELTDRYSENGTDEAIFKMVSNANDHRGSQFSDHFRSDGENTPSLRIARDLYEKAIADPADLRGQNWYTIENEGLENEKISMTKFNGRNYFDVPLIHVTELKMVRAEAAAELNMLDEGLADLNDIRMRAGLAQINGPIGQMTLISRIRDEKRKELVAEGVRFHDLRRIGAKGENITINGSPWNCPGMSVQFPDTEIAGAGGREFFTPNEEGGC